MSVPREQRAKMVFQFLNANRGQKFDFGEVCARLGLIANQGTRSAINKYTSEMADAAGLYLLFPCPENDWQTGIANDPEDWIGPQRHLRKIMGGLARREGQGTNEQRRQLQNFDPAPRSLFESALDVEDDIVRLIDRRDRMIERAVSLL